MLRDPNDIGPVPRLLHNPILTYVSLRDLRLG